MKLLALDCSTEACSVALLDTSAGIELVEKTEPAARQHTQRLLPLVDDLLTETGVSLAQLDAIAFGRGPGSFTGLRICLGAVQGLAFGADVPVVPVSTLAALAQTAVNAGHSSPTILSTLDARMDEIYWALYRVQEQGVELLGQERLSAPEQLLDRHSADLGATIAVGSGYHYRDRIAVASQFKLWDGALLPSAAAIAQLAQRDYLQGKTCQADEALPTYLRDEVAWQKQPL
ncbi:tRNA (adenosine(37)-N6)-threonylcarbamoyltransferase complex dimerization subunit type 1 TsaB [Oceanicoccus sagamiensis]|uniref:tRNA threonylcarbamoyladenosine biosynthesis protein TsaB n=1 Tax=Oceanicoccus sagamiensis TaxID=716816 RepID=A0A1X9NCR4_9GAMM|nr:tRNA (adenosine(37)-N6)-threonylcarbamoyltransferase complex dimerization subunit type 1 TsaB [Oceanicoccus sagamiensis]ARN75366.1 tRNA (adenosine(37)-N6)-threonylcarbamoyltransferase complex dimerization subunit type 1 TsaB [Oceanicoccus sagamiensis]